MGFRCTRLAVSFEQYDPKSPKPRLSGGMSGIVIFENIAGGASKERIDARLEAAKRFINEVEAAAKLLDGYKISPDAKAKIKGEARDLAVTLLMEIGAAAICEIDKLGDEKQLSAIAESIKGQTGLIPQEVLESALQDLKPGHFTKIYSRLGSTDPGRAEMLNDVLIASITGRDVSLQRFISEILFDVENVPAFVRLAGLQGEFTARINTDYFTAWG